MMKVAWTFLTSASYSPLGLMENSVSVGGMHVGKLMKNPDYHPLTRSAMKTLIQMYSDGKIKPHIDSVWHFEQVSLLVTMSSAINK